MSLPVAVAALLIVSLVTYLVGRLYGSAVFGSENALARIRRVLFPGLLVGALLGLAAFVGAGGLDPVRAALGHGIVGDAVALAVVAGAAFVPALATYLGLFPAIRSTRDLDVGTASAAVRFSRAIAALLVTFGVVIFVVGHAPVSSAPGFLALIVVLLVVVYLGSGPLIRLTRATRKPTDDERERIRAAAARAGHELRSVRVIGTDETENPRILARGPVGRRTLFVGSYLLSGYDDEQVLAVQVVRAMGMVSRWYHEARLGAVIGFMAAIVVFLAPLPSWTAPVGYACLLLAVGLLWYGSRVVYAADREAAAATDAETVASFYRELAEEAGVSLESGGRVRGFLRMRPPLGRRIARVDEPAD